MSVLAAQHDDDEDLSWTRRKREVRKRIKIYNWFFSPELSRWDISQVIIKKSINNKLKNYCTEATYQNDQQNKIKHNGNFQQHIKYIYSINI